MFLIFCVLIECGGQLRGPTGVINLANTTNLFDTPNSYHLRCTWNITVRPGRTILVKLMILKLYPHDLCVDNYVLVSRHHKQDDFEVNLQIVLLQPSL